MQRTESTIKHVKIKSTEKPKKDQESGKERGKDEMKRGSNEIEEMR